MVYFLQIDHTLAQNHPCAVPSDFKSYPTELYQKLKKKNKNFKVNGILNIPVKAHAIRKPNTSPGQTYTPALLRGIEQANQQIDHLGIRFMLCDQINVINDREYGFVDFEIGHQLHIEHKITGAVNLYIAQSLDTGGGQACGWATLPWWRTTNDYDYIFMAEGCMDDNTTLAHEIGHYLGLYHTHNVMDSMIVDSITMDTINYGIEFVDQSNCEFAGDGICDTAADPLLGGRNVSSCKYDGREEDPLGVPYADAEVLPDPKNRMSYAPTGCVEYFSDGQYEVMSVWLAERIPELTCKGHPDFELNSTLYTTENYYPGVDIDLIMDLAMYSFDNEAIKPEIGIYLSKNSIIDSLDRLIYSGEFPDYEVNSEFQHGVQFSLPEDFEDRGVHFILVLVDMNNEFPELYKGNNFAKETIFLESAPTSINDWLTGKGSQIFPNPVQDQLTINGLGSWNQTEIIIEVHNVIGVHVDTYKHHVYDGQVTKRGLQLFPGHYTLKLSTLDGEVITHHSIIKE